MEFKRVIKERTFQRLQKMLRQYETQACFTGRYYAAVEACPDEDQEAKIKGCISLVKRSWFLTEIKHLFVREEYRGNGIGKYLVEEALQKVKTPLCGCTIRENNGISLNIFYMAGFSVVKRFSNPRNGNEILFLIKEMEVQDERG